MSASRKKIAILLITCIAAAVVGLAVVLLVRTSWTPAFVYLDENTVLALHELLEDEGIRTKVDLARGVIYVPVDQVDEAWIAAQLSPVMLQQRFDFERAVAEIGEGVTPQMQSHMIMRARETEIQDTLMRLEGITHADVLLVMPTSTEAVMTNFPVSATITIRGDGVTPEMGEIVAQIAERAVYNLKKENVTVIDGGNLIVLFNGGVAARWIDFELQFLEMAQRIALSNDAEEILAELFDFVEITTNVRLDWNEIDAFEPLWQFADEYSDFPGRPIFNEGLAALFENEVVRRYIIETILNTCGECGATTSLTQSQSEDGTNINLLRGYIMMICGECGSEVHFEVD